jgi:hypothetical protein
MTIKPTHQIAYDYCMAQVTQAAAVDQLNSALRGLGSDNLLYSLCEPLEHAYTLLVEKLLGPELFEWVIWWIYEADHGNAPMLFVVDDIAYNPTEITMYRFLEIVDAS